VPQGTLYLLGLSLAFDFDFREREREEKSKVDYLWEMIVFG
jgi:hypothetical protein